MARPPQMAQVMRPAFRSVVVTTVCWQWGHTACPGASRSAGITTTEDEKCTTLQIENLSPQVLSCVNAFTLSDQYLGFTNLMETTIRRNTLYNVTLAQWRQITMIGINTDLWLIHGDAFTDTIGLFFTAEVLTWHCRKYTGVTGNINTHTLWLKCSIKTLRIWNNTTPRTWST